MTLSSLKQEIWLHAKVNRNVVVLQTYADKAQVRLPITQVHEAEKLLKLLNKPKKAPAPKLARWVIDKYCEAHYRHTLQYTPSVVRDGHYCKPIIPKTHTSNGLNKFIENYIIWMGGRATRINVAGRIIKSKSGKNVRIKSATRTGAADISSTIFGKSVMWETKIGADIACDDQLREQSIEQRAGGEYFFIKTAEDFLNEYRDLVNLA